MDSTCLVPTVKHGGGGVMVWGCFAGDTVGDLFKIEGMLNQHGYHSILQRHATPSGLQQDNDPKHTSRLCKGYLTKKESDGVLCQMTWPPQSPDLNSFEMVWGELDCRVKAKGPTSAKYLWELLQDCWKTISGDYLLKLIKRMPRVCKAVIKAKVPLTAAISFTHIEVKFLETFGVTFGVEGDTVTLSCAVLLTPDLSRLRPEAEWYRDDVLIKETKWHQLHFGEGRASLTLTHLNKDDEGLYTVRMVTRAGVNQHSGFLFVADAAALVAGAPGAPMDVECHDANKDYVIVSWKPPNTASEAPVIGYFVDKCEVGTENWIQCNDSPVKICKYPVTGLFEGRSYFFRVRAVNKAGISRPSRVSIAVAALDPADLSRLQNV
ncbi:unnamed protein product [Ranitomeya imitator]|uniref:Uncharacterized protein n=1 Tax=Ranitomeya imitator TaxID=111125 RepID=A0ABN9L982_9NEOB|nr:unnamed protein product [Ranitomeya imitator]